MWLYEVDITVSGRSTTTRGGESKVMNFGAQWPLPVISTRFESPSRSTSTSCNAAGPLGPAVCASPTASSTSGNKAAASSCFRILLFSVSRTGFCLPGDSYQRTGSDFLLGGRLYDESAEKSIKSSERPCYAAPN